MELIRGIVAAPVLPMTEDFEVDWTGLRAYLRWLVPQGPTAIAMNMDAAEGPSLSVEERLRVIEASREAAVQHRDYQQALAIWDRIGPMARMMWSPPLRDYRPRLKEALVMLGVLRSAAVRPPLMPVSDDEGGTIRRLLVHAGLLPA
jgi:dihydrodipicolinate synthase/N-acetylneuraminate lyase